MGFWGAKLYSGDFAMEARAERPTMASIWSEPSCALRRPGTCSRPHRAWMETETLGHVTGLSSP